MRRLRNRNRLWNPADSGLVNMRDEFHRIFIHPPTVTFFKLKWKLGEVWCNELNVKWFLPLTIRTYLVLYAMRE